MTEQDNIRDLFSKGLESHTTPVRPEVWHGLQTKMAAAGVASGSAAAVKGISALTKWIIGGAAATAVVVTTVALTKDTETKTQKEQEQTVAFSPSADSNSETDKAQTVTFGEVQPEDIGVPGGNEVVPDNRAAGNPTVDRTEEKSASERQYPPSIAAPVKTPESSNRENGVPPVIPPVKPAETPKAEPKQPAGNGITAPEPKVEPKAVSRSKILKIPNVFTPNNDGENDYFTVDTKLVSDFSVTIMDQKNNVIFKSSDPDFKWDGKTLAGDDCPSGSYFCLIVARGEQNELLKEYKSVELRK